MPKNRRYKGESKRSFRKRSSKRGNLAKRLRRSPGKIGFRL